MTAAPTVVYIEQTTAGASVTLPSISTLATPAVGDLCVIVQSGTRNTIGTPTAPKLGGVDAGFSTDASKPDLASASGKAIAFSKVLTSSDFVSGKLVQYALDNTTFNPAPHRAAIYIFHHASGFGSDRVFQAVTNFTTFTANAAQTLTDCTRAAVVVAVAGWVSTGVTSPQITWDGGTARIAYCDSSSSICTLGGHAARTDTTGVTTTSGNATVADPGVIAADLNKVLAAPAFTGGQTVSTITLGTGFTASAPANASGSTVTFNQPRYGNTQSTITASSDYNEYASTDTIASWSWSAGTANGTHVFLVITYQVAVPTTVGTMAIVGGGTVHATGTTTVPGTATIVGGGNAMHANGTRVGIGTLSITGGGTLTAAQQGVAHVTGTANFAGNGTLSAVGAPLVTGTMQIAGGGIHQAFGLRTVVGTSLITGGGTFHLDQRHDVTVYTVGGTWSSSSQNVAGGRTWTGTAGFQGHGTFTAAGVTLTAGHGDARLNGIATLSATGVRTVFGTASFSNSVDFELKPLNLTNSDRVTLEHSSRLTLDTSSRITIDG